MKNAAFGIRMHSGWGVLVCISGSVSAAEIVARRRIVIVEPTMEGAKQPYHFAETLPLEEAEGHLQKCAAASERLALKAMRDMLDAVNARNYRVVGCAMLLASGRALPPLPNILASHALVHTAEGEFFRKIELDERATATFGKAAASVRQHISRLGKTVGSPWTQDEKTAALAGYIV